MINTPPKIIPELPIPERIAPMPECKPPMTEREQLRKEIALNLNIALWESRRAVLLKLNGELWEAAIKSYDDNKDALEASFSMHHSLMQNLLESHPLLLEEKKPGA